MTVTFNIFQLYKSNGYALVSRWALPMDLHLNIKCDSFYHNHCHESYQISDSKLLSACKCMSYVILQYNLTYIDKWHNNLNLKYYESPTAYSNATFGISVQKR